MAAHCVHIITLGPELTAPQLTLHLRMKTENLLRRDALHQLNLPTRTQKRYALNQKMDMVLVRADLNELQLIALRYLQTNLSKALVNLFGENNTTIFRRTYIMV